MQGITGGGVVDLTQQNVFSGTDYNYTATADGIFVVHFAKNSVSYSITLSLNEVVVYNGYWNYGYANGGVITGTWTVPVKRGDKIKIESNALPTENFWTMCYLSKYK